MSFLGILGSIGKSLIGLGGGTNANKVADAVLEKLGQVGPVASGAAQGSANQRVNENLMALRGAQFNREGQDRAQKNAILMQLLNGIQDAKVTPGNPRIASAMGTSVGGLRPSALTANRDALMALLGQPQIQAPETEAGGMEKTLGGVGLAGSILGALRGGVKRPQVYY